MFQNRTCFPNRTCFRCHKNVRFERTPCIIKDGALGLLKSNLNTILPPGNLKPPSCWIRWNYGKVNSIIFGIDGFFSNFRKIFLLLRSYKRSFNFLIFEFVFSVNLKMSIKPRIKIDWNFLLKKLKLRIFPLSFSDIFWSFLYIFFVFLINAVRVFRVEGQKNKMKIKKYFLHVLKLTVEF